MRKIFSSSALVLSLVVALGGGARADQPVPARYLRLTTSFSGNPCTSSQPCVWKKSDGTLHFTFGGTDTQLAAGGGGGGSFTGGPVTSFMSYSGTASAVPSSPWTACTLSGTWVNFDVTTYASCAYFKDSDGVVHLKGMVKDGATNSTIFTLPAGFRPSKTLQIAMAYYYGSFQMDVVTIDPAGVVSQALGSGTTWQELDGISFLAEQ